MKARRYKKSWDIVPGLDEVTGKDRLDVRYSGDWFLCDRPPKEWALKAAAPVAVHAAATLAYLIAARATDRCMYALMPVLLGLFPGLYALMGLYGLYRCPRRMTIVQRENGPGRLVRSSLGCTVLSAAATAGCAVCLTVNGRWTDGWYEPLLTAVAALGALTALRIARQCFSTIHKEA